MKLRWTIIEMDNPAEILLPLEIGIFSESDLNATNGVRSEIVITHFVGFTKEGSEH
jgi:hypothetical protein